MSIEQARFLEGWLVAKEAPPRVMESIAEVIAALSTKPSLAQKVPSIEFDIPLGPNNVSPDETAPEPTEQARVTKTRTPWPPERKAAQAERMRQTQARRRVVKDVQPGNFPAPSMGGA